MSDSDDEAEPGAARKGLSRPEVACLLLNQGRKLMTRGLYDEASEHISKPESTDRPA